MYLITLRVVTTSLPHLGWLSALRMAIALTFTLLLTDYINTKLIYFMLYRNFLTISRSRQSRWTLELPLASLSSKLAQQCCASSLSLVPGRYPYPLKRIIQNNHVSWPILRKSSTIINIGLLKH